MATLKFKGPFHFEHIFDPKRNPKQGNCGDINSLLPPNKPGIYIWGFIFDLKKKQLNNPVDFNKEEILPFEYQLNCLSDLKVGSGPIGVDLSKQSKNWKFIPYYVGLDANLLDRIKDHHQITKGHSRKYTRLKSNRYKDFFYAGNFPIFIKSNGTKQRKEILELIINKNNPIDFFNNYFVLREIHSDISLSSCPGLKELWNDLPIDICCWKNKQDTLDHIINNENNFWFCYAELEPNDENFYLKEKKIHPKTNFLNYPEAQTFYSLKGITISETLDHTKIKQNPFTVNFKIDAEPTCMDIFKQDPINTIVNNTNFPGY